MAYALQPPKPALASAKALHGDLKQLHSSLIDVRRASYPLAHPPKAPGQPENTFLRWLEIILRTSGFTLSEVAKFNLDGKEPGEAAYQRVKERHRKRVRYRKNPTGQAG